MVAHPWAKGGAEWEEGGLTALSFAIGGLTSIVSGYIGMMVAVYSNARTALEARRGATDDAAEGWTASFNTAFRAGSVMDSPCAACRLAFSTFYASSTKVLKGFLDDATRPRALRVHRRVQPRWLIDRHVRPRWRRHLHEGSRRRR